MTDKNFSQQSLAEYGTLKNTDIQAVNRCRNDYNKLGFGYQVAFVKLFNYFPKIVPFEVIEEIVIFVGLQIKVDSKKIEEYSKNRFKIIEHQQEITNYLCLVKFNTENELKIKEYIYNEALRLEAHNLLKIKTILHLKKNRILSPSEIRLSKIISGQRQKARKVIFDNVQQKLSLEIINNLNLLLESQGTISKLEFLKKPPYRASVNGILNLLEKLDYIRSTGALSIDISMINNNYQKILTREVKSYSITKLRKIDPLYRYAAIVCFLHQNYKDSNDFLAESCIKLLSSSYKRADKIIKLKVTQNEKEIRKALKNYSKIKEVVRDEAVPDIELRTVLYKKFKAELIKIDNLELLLTGKYGHAFNLFVEKYGYFRQFTPKLLENLEMKLEEGSESDVLKAIEVLKNLNENKKRQLPKNIPTKFIPKGIKKFVIINGKIDRRAWECALLFKIKEDLKHNNLVLENGKRFSSFNRFFMPEVTWKNYMKEFFRNNKLPENAKDAEAYLTNYLGEAYDIYFMGEKGNKHAKIVDGKWELKRDHGEHLTKKQQESLTFLKNFIGSNLRSIKLPDLLIEVDNKLQFTEAFMLPNQENLRIKEDICGLILTIMAHGCNIGIYTMSQLVNDVSYDYMKRITDWQLSDEALRTALAWIVNAISKLNITKNWGEGKRSSSDSHLVTFKEKVLQQEFSVKLGEFALKFYTFVADNYAPFLSKPIQCYESEGAHVLDGKLYNESDLPLEEHFTDTAAAGAITFASFAFIGSKFNPRIRGIQNHNIFKIDNNRDYKSLSSLLTHKESTIDMTSIVNQWDRMAHFYGSITTGHVSASLAMRKLLSFNSKNEFYKANLQLGRIFKTANTLKSMVDPEIRKKRNDDLLKGEEMHQLARDVNYGNRGKITGRDLIAQRNSCNCLTLIMACIIYWQAKEMSRILREGNIPEWVDLSMIKHISPIGWENVVLYGEYNINKSLIA